MKKIYTILCASALTFVSTVANATMHYVAVGVNSSSVPTMAFTPNALTANVGDTVTFVLAAGTHNVTSTSVPSGAATMSSGTLSTPGQTYVYPITQAGTYNYTCTFHAGMNGTINATATGVTEYHANWATTAYPNPFTNKLTMSYSGVESVSFLNVVGELVKQVTFTSTEGKTEIDFEGLPAGIYFYRTYKEGEVVETKKLIKTK